MLQDKCKKNSIMWWQMSVKLSNSIIKQLHARLLSNGNSVVFECWINKCKHISILCIVL